MTAPTENQAITDVRGGRPDLGFIEDSVLPKGFAIKGVGTTNSC